MRNFGRTSFLTRFIMRIRVRDAARRPPALRCPRPFARGLFVVRAQVAPRGRSDRPIPFQRGDGIERSAVNAAAVGGARSARRLTVRAPGINPGGPGARTAVGCGMTGHERRELDPKRSRAWRWRRRDRLSEHPCDAGREPTSGKWPDRKVRIVEDHAARYQARSHGGGTVECQVCDGDRQRVEETSGLASSVCERKGGRHELQRVADRDPHDLAVVRSRWRGGETHATVRPRTPAASSSRPIDQRPPSERPRRHGASREGVAQWVDST